MFDAVKLLRELQECISESSQFNWDGGDYERLLFAEVKGLLHIEFYGEPWRETFAGFVKLVCIPDVASKIGALFFRSPDEGANGTNNWDFSKLIESEITFPNLKILFVEPYQLDWHNHPIIAECLEEAGMISKLITKMPNLQSMTVPNAPDASFFEMRRQSLSYLRVESGYDHQNFILNFSRSLCFPNLEVLDFSDYNEQYVDDYPAACTPFEYYVELFRSQAFASIRMFVLRNAVLSETELAELHGLRKDITFRFVKSYGDYVYVK